MPFARGLSFARLSTDKVGGRPLVPDVAALKPAMSLTGPTVVDVVVTPDPAKMLPGVDNRAATIRKGDRVA